MSFVMMVFIIVPILAPAPGGAFLLVGPWRLIFAALGAIAVAALPWIALRLPETRPPRAARAAVARLARRGLGEAMRTAGPSATRWRTGSSSAP